jgi:hypothetical protein
LNTIQQKCFVPVNVYHWYENKLNINVCIYMMHISSMYIVHEEDFNFILFNHFHSKCPLGTNPWWPLYMNGLFLFRCSEEVNNLLNIYKWYIQVFSFFGVFFFCNCPVDANLKCKNELLYWCIKFVKEALATILIKKNYVLEIGK